MKQIQTLDGQKKKWSTKDCSLKKNKKNKSKRIEDQYFLVKNNCNIIVRIGLLIKLLRISQSGKIFENSTLHNIILYYFRLVMVMRSLFANLTDASPYPLTSLFLRKKKSSFSLSHIVLSSLTRGRFWYTSFTLSCAV